MAAPAAEVCDNILDLPDAILLSIFNCLDAYDLANRVAFVNQRFRRLLACPFVWRTRLPQALGVPSGDCQRQPCLSQLWFTVFNSNLLRNPWLSLDHQKALPCARVYGAVGSSRGRVPWLAVGGGHQWAWSASTCGGLNGDSSVEQPPPPMPLPPLEQGSRPAWHPPSCVAAVHGEGGPWPALVQEVDLVGELGRRGVGPAAACAFLDTSPPIALQVHAATHTAGEQCEALLVLDGKQGPVPVGSVELLAWLRSCDLRCDARLAGPPRRWCPLDLVCRGYGAGVRRAVVVLRAKPPQPSPSRAGPKLACPVLSFLPPPSPASPAC